MKYSIWLGNPGGMSYGWQELCEEVHKLFAPVVAKSKFTSHRVRSTMTKPGMQVSDLLIYVVFSQERGVLAHHFGGTKMADDQYGLTGWDGTYTASEVYTRGMSKRFVANLIFHEAMHNKLHQGNSMHSNDGLARGMLTEYSVLTQKNIESMSKGISKLRSQWLGGFDAVTPGGLEPQSSPTDGL